MQKFIIAIICWTILAAACYFEITDNNIPATETTLGVSVLRKGGSLFSNGEPFSGYLLEHYDDGAVKSRTGYMKGKAEGWAYGFYNNRDTAWKRYYKNGKKQDVHYGWWQNRKPQFIYRYTRDMFEGEQVSYYANGRLAQIQHYKDGHEEGTQQSWSQAGKLTSNYTVKNGRRYGIIGRTDCVSVYKR